MKGGLRPITGKKWYPASRDKRLLFGVSKQVKIRLNRKLMCKLSPLLVILMLAVLVFSGCRAGLGAVPKGWSGGTVADDALIIGSMEGKLVAVETSDGSPRWAPYVMERQQSGGFGCTPVATAVAIYGAPAVAGDKFDIDDYLVYIGGYDGKVYAINFGKGAGILRWIFPREASLHPIIGSPVIAQDKLYFGSANGIVYALDAETGDSLWNFPTKDKIWSTPAIEGDTLFIGSFDNKFYALDAADGSKKWEFETEGAIVSTPLVHNNTVYIGSFDRYLYALDIADGSLKWKFLAENWFWAKPVIHNGAIYAGCLDGKVYVLDISSGDKLAELDMGSAVSSSPVLVGDSVIVATQDGVVYAVDTGNYQKRMLVDLEETVNASLATDQNNVYVHTVNDTLYAIDARSGAKREFNIKF